MRLALAFLLLPLASFGQGFSEASAPFLLSTSPLRRGLIGYWRFEEPASGTRYDFSSTGAALVSNNSVGQTAGKVGNCASFKSTSSQFLNTSNTNFFNFTSANPFTFATWVKLTNTGSAQVIIGKQVSTPLRGYELYAGTSGRLSFSLATDSSHYFIMAGTTSITNEAWHFVAVTYTGSATTNGVSLYVDNALETITSSTQTGAITLLQIADNLYFGKQNQATPFYLNGLIDEPGMWNRVLPTTGSGSLSNLYNATLGTHFPWAHP